MLNSEKSVPLRDTNKTFCIDSDICSVFITADAVSIKKAVLLKDKSEIKKLKMESCRAHEFPLPELIVQMRRYFGGEAVGFDFICDLDRLTHLEREILSIVKNIPYAKTMTYEEVAERVGNKNLRRVVGRAVAKNPCPIIIPCHRVVGKGGKLTGFSADGGIALKAELLMLEGIIIK